MNMNLGCGRNIMDGWANIDSVSLPGVDHVVDLDTGPGALARFAYEPVTNFFLSHVLEHIKNPLPLMQACWDVAAPNAYMEIRCPYGSSDDADEDPTHVRRMFLQSTGYFSQPYYWRADYGYLGDWRTDLITLFVDAQYDGVSDADVMSKVHTYRNVVREIVYEMRAVKPRREPLRALQTLPNICIRYTP